MEYLKIHISSNKLRVRCYSNSPFFDRNERFKVSQTYEKLIIERSGLDWVGKDYSCIKKKRGSHVIDFKRETDELIEGRIYYPDVDESSEDKLVFYYED